MSAVDDGLEPRSTKSVDGECRHRDGDATPQTHMAGNVWRVGRALSFRGQNIKDFISDAAIKKCIKI